MEPRWRLSHARGYIELGMYRDAVEELDALPADLHGGAEALVLRAAAFQGLGDWKRLMPIAAALVHVQPGDAGHWVTWAYATRRADSLAAAERILRQASLLHPREATITFNLGCYACQRGDLAAAQDLVDQAIALNPAFQTAAAEDPDLEPLRQAGYLR